MENQGPHCSCGSGRMKLYISKKQAIYGRYFYCCPDWKDHPGSFVWLDDYRGPKISRSNGMIQQDRNKHNQLYAKWMVIACCGCNACLILLSMLLILILLLYILRG